MSINIFTNPTILELAHPEFTDIKREINIDEFRSGGLSEVSYTIDGILLPVFIGVTSTRWRFGMRQLAIVPILENSGDQSEIFLERIVPNTFLRSDGFTASDILETYQDLPIYRNAGRLINTSRFNTFIGSREIKLRFRGLGSVS